MKKLVTAVLLLAAVWGGAWGKGGEETENRGPGEITFAFMAACACDEASKMDNTFSIQVKAIGRGDERIKTVSYNMALKEERNGLFAFYDGEGILPEYRAVPALYVDGYAFLEREVIGEVIESIKEGGWDPELYLSYKMTEG